MKRHKANGGFTVMELMIALVLGVILMAASYAIYMSQHRGFEKIEEITSTVQSARMAVDQLSRELRMAGFGVVTGETFLVAKKYSITFYGDIDADISGVLANGATAGDSQIDIDLRDGHDIVEAGDYIFINGGGNTEMIQVAQSGEVVDWDGEPDTIRLNEALANDYAAGETLVRSIESVAYDVSFPAGRLERNDVLLADGLQDLEFHYYGDEDQELTPDPVNGLNQIERAAVRKIEIRITVGSEGGWGTRTIVNAIDLRNMGNRPFSVDTCAPNPPTNLQVTETGLCERFTIRWTAPTNNACDGSTMTDLGGYKIYYGTGSETYFVPPSNVSDETVTEFTVEDLRLNNNTTYYVSMKAYDQSFNESEYATEISFLLSDTDAPAAPVITEASAAVGSVSLNWEAPDDEDVKGFRLYRGTTAGFTANEGTRIADEEVLTEETLSYTDDGLEPCTTYYYKISAVDCANEGELSAEAFGDGDGPGSDQPESTVTDTTPTESPAVAPEKPSPFQAIGRSEAVDLYWTNPADSDFARVVVRYSTVSYPNNPLDGESVGDFAGSPSATVSETHSNLINGTTYYYSAFAYDRCGNYGQYAYTSAEPGGTAPVAEVISPIDGSTITSGELVFQVRAYDPDQPGLHEPPSVTDDNGAGITSMTFYVDPNPNYLYFPRAEYAVEYCGFSGNNDPCTPGDVTTWCDGTYQLYGVATDDEGQYSPSPFVSVTIHNGGIYLDESYTAQLGGTYNNEVTFQIQNDSSVTATIQEVQPTWTQQMALLKSIEIPDGSTVWEDTSHPRSSGDLLALDYGSQPTIAGGATKTVTFVYTRQYTTLALTASAGSTTINVSSWGGFSAGDTIYLIDGGQVEQATIDSIDDGQFTLTSGLTNGFPYGSIVRHTQEADDVSMSGAELRVVLNYKKSTFSNSCSSDELLITFSANPQIINVQQDMPSDDTAASTVQGQIEVENYRSVPVHLEVVDHASAGIAEADLYYYVDGDMQTVAPTSGYANLEMTYNESEAEWQATIPYQSDCRIWYYVTTRDNNDSGDRSPSTGSYTYDYAPDTTAPVCPLGITATQIAKKQINLSWLAGAEADIAGYNIYRSNDCGSFSRMYTRVTDIDPDTPGVQYIDDDNRLDADKYCHTYYITAVDQQGNESSGCSVYTAAAGDCPCP